MTLVKLRTAWRLASLTARAMVGLPDYGNYVAHVRAHHPGREPLTEAAFFRACQQSRYGGRQGRCC